MLKTQAMWSKNLANDDEKVKYPQFEPVKISRSYA